jgi:hypothetical protein
MENLTREDRYKELAEDCYNFEHDDYEEEPKRFAGVELNSGDAVWMYTADSLAELAATLSDSETQADDWKVIDLDTGVEHYARRAVTIPERQE